MFKTKGNYGQCPKCGENRQPPDSPDTVGNLIKDWCYCCDCGIMWTISYPAEWLMDEPHLHWDSYDIEDVKTFDEEFEPYDC